ncbi:MAG: DivIVA domain-containing [Desulfobulbaceae bacterium]|nr:MAG: DivIVA domain-containing [Desulfobulbaceae bacterium]
MTTTPQIIKDQEFQVKFRGYDPLEVKAYLDELAEEFFELQERCRLQVEDLQVLHEERAELEQQKYSLEAGGAEARKMAEELRQTGLLTEQKFAVLANEAEGLRNKIASLEREKEEQADAVTALEARLQKAKEATLQEKAEKEALGHKIALMEEQKREAKKDEVDFRSTLAVAQQFCDSMKQKSQQEAEELLQTAKAEIEAIRKAAHDELASLPEEISALQQKREEVRKVLRTTLETYLRNLDIFPEDKDGLSPWQDTDDLFQKMQILEDGTLAAEDMASINGEEPAVDSASSLEEESDLMSVFDGEDSDNDDEDAKGL